MSHKSKAELMLPWLLKIVHKSKNVLKTQEMIAGYLINPFMTEADII